METQRLKAFARQGLLAVFAALAVHAQAAAVADVPATTKHFLWEVASLTNRIYLYGTIHAGRKEWFPLPAAIEDAFNDSAVLVVEADITDEGAARSAVEQTLARFGRLDTVVANAGVMLLGPIENAPIQEWQRMVDTNVLGLLYTAHAALPHLLQAASGEPRQVADLVLISSVAGRVPRNGSGVYNLTKHGVGAFGEALRQEVTKRHVRVSLIEPGAVATELAGHNRPEVQETMRARFQTMERMEAVDIAETIGFVVTRPRRVAINEVLIRPTEQEQ